MEACPPSQLGRGVMRSVRPSSPRASTRRRSAMQKRIAPASVSITTSSGLLFRMQGSATPSRTACSSNWRKLLGLVMSIIA